MRVSEIKDTLERQEEVEIKEHREFLRISLKILYELVEEYYLTELSTKLIKTLTLLANGTFDETSFFADISKQENPHFAFFMPSIHEGSSETNQITLDGFDEANKVPNTIETYASILDVNNKILTQNIYSMKKNFQPKFYDYLVFLIDILSLSPKKEHQVILKSIMKIGEISYKIKVKPKNTLLEPITQMRFILK